MNFKFVLNTLKTEINGLIIITTFKTEVDYAHTRYNTVLQTIDGDVLKVFGEGSANFHMTLDQMQKHQKDICNDMKHERIYKVFSCGDI